MISINQVTKKKTNQSVEKTVLKNISCEIPKNRITVFIGKSGAGKTTLLRCIAGLEGIDEGSITLSGKSLSDLSRQEHASTVGFVFQNYSLFPNLTIRENCMQPLMVVKQLDKATAQRKAQAMLELLGVDSLQDSYPRQLSGGQQQRVALARTLCMEPKAILLDEPTSALDPENAKILQQILQKLSANGITIVISCQDIRFIQSIAEQIYLIDDGKIVAQADTKTAPLDQSPEIGLFLRFSDKLL